MTDRARLLSRLTTDNTDSRISELESYSSFFEFFKRAVVVDVLNDLSLSEINKYESKISNPGFLFTKIEVKGQKEPKSVVIAPTNSLIVQMIGTNKSGQNKSYEVVYPFFSSHFSLPVKPGEHVWIFSKTNRRTGSNSSDECSYWMTRIAEKLNVEDLNYTHSDRRYDSIVKNNEDKKPNFPNGRTNESLQNYDEKYLYTLEEKDAYEKIINNSLQKDRVVPEPVPRFKKKPGDLVLHGSNNSAIILGTNRGFTEEQRPDQNLSNASQNNSEGQGSIDLVVGRGRIHTDLSQVNEKEPDKKTTRPRVIKNTRNKFEVDKNISAKEDPNKNDNSKIDINEGDPDFINDSARLFMSMMCDVDNLFGISGKNIYKSVDSDSEMEDKSGSAIVVKSDHVRIIARKTKDKLINAEPEDISDINGTIRIVKEGSADSGCSIYLLEDGTIQISGAKIILGNAESDGGKSSQPYMRFDEFSNWEKNLKEATINSFKDIENKINNLRTTLSTAFNASYCVPFAPDASLQVAAQTPDLSSTYKNATISILEQKFDAIEPIKSERVFGE